MPGPAAAATTQQASFILHAYSDAARLWGIDFSGEARRGSRPRLDGAGAFRSRLTASVEGWRRIGPLTAFASAGQAQSRDTEGVNDRERFQRAGLEWSGPGRSLWMLEAGRSRFTGWSGTEREATLSWSMPVLRDWRLGVQAGAFRSPGFRDHDLRLTLRVPL